MKKHLTPLLITLIMFSSPFMIIPNSSTEINKSLETVEQTNTKETPLNHIWPMHKNDAQRTGYSPCDSSRYLGGELWKYLFEEIEEHTAVIDSNGTLYISMYIDLNGELHAI